MGRSMGGADAERAQCCEKVLTLRCLRRRTSVSSGLVQALARGAGEFAQRLADPVRGVHHGGGGGPAESDAGVREGLHEREVEVAPDAGDLAGAGHVAEQREAVGRRAERGEEQLGLGEYK